MKNTQKGFAIPLIIALVAMMAIVGMFFYFQNDFHLIGADVPDPIESDFEPLPSTESGNFAPVTEEADFIDYNSSIYGISTKYPSNWTVQEQEDTGLIVFLSPLEETSDIFRENVNIVIQDLSSEPMTLMDYTDISIGQIDENISDSTIHESGSVSLNGTPAYKVVYTGKFGQYNLKWNQVWTIKNNTAYVLTYTAEVDKYNDFMFIAEEAIKSLEIK